MNKLYLITSAFLLFTTSNALAGQVRCEKIFDFTNKARSEKVALPKLPEFILNPHALDSKKVEKLGFSVSAKGELFDKKTNQSLGKIYTLDAHHLFQWADKEFHKQAIQSGITADWMNEIRQAPSQTAGKGFYVALESVSSHSYGDALTTFILKKPLVVLIDKSSPGSHLVNVTDGVERLAELGIDAFRFSSTYPAEWLSIISERPLKNPIRDDVENYQTSAMYLRVATAKSTYTARMSDFMIHQADFKILLMIKDRKYANEQLTRVMSQMSAYELGRFMIMNKDLISRLKPLLPEKHKKPIEQILEVAAGNI